MEQIYCVVLQQAVAKETVMLNAVGLGLIHLLLIVMNPIFLFPCRVALVKDFLTGKSKFFRRSCGSIDMLPRHIRLGTSEI